MAAELRTLDDLRSAVKGIRTAMVTTIDERGTLSSRPVTVQEITGNGDIWMLVDERAAWVAPADGQPVNVALVDDGKLWVSCAGRVQLDRSAERVEQLSDPISGVFFDDEESRPIGMCVVTDSIEWWKAANKVGQLVDMVKAAITGDAAELGTSGTIDVDARMETVTDA